MILVLLGTQNKPFKRIIDKIIKEKENGNIKEKVIAQVGCTKCNSDKIEVFDFVSKDKLENLIDKARVIITHGGVGIITECINKNKKVIVVPRLKKYKEHTNDHQLQITKEFYKNGYVLALYNVKDLLKVLNNIKKFKPKKYKSNADNFKERLEFYIDNI